MQTQGWVPLPIVAEVADSAVPTLHVFGVGRLSLLITDATVGKPALVGRLPDLRFDLGHALLLFRSANATSTTLPLFTRQWQGM